MLPTASVHRSYHPELHVACQIPTLAGGQCFAGSEAFWCGSCPELYRIRQWEGGCEYQPADVSTGAGLPECGYQPANISPGAGLPFFPEHEAWGIDSHVNLGSCGSRGSHVEPPAAQCTLWALQRAAEPGPVGPPRLKSGTFTDELLELLVSMPPDSPRGSPQERRTMPSRTGLGFFTASPAPVTTQGVTQGVTRGTMHRMLRISSSPTFRALSRSGDPLPVSPPFVEQPHLPHRDLRGPLESSGMRCLTAPEGRSWEFAAHGAAGTRHRSVAKLMRQRAFAEQLLHSRGSTSRRAGNELPQYRGERQAEWHRGMAFSGGSTEEHPLAGLSSEACCVRVPAASLATSTRMGKLPGPALAEMGSRGFLDDDGTSAARAHVVLHKRRLYGKLVRDCTMLAMEEAAAAHVLKTCRQAVPLLGGEAGRVLRQLPRYTTTEPRGESKPTVATLGTPPPSPAKVSLGTPWWLGCGRPGSPCAALGGSPRARAWFQGSGLADEVGGAIHGVYYLKRDGRPQQP